jgi:hypothetical protein
MPVPEGTIFRYRKIDNKNGIPRRQRLAIHNHKVIESKTEEKTNGWITVRGDENKLGTIRRTL